MLPKESYGFLLAPVLWYFSYLSGGVAKAKGKHHMEGGAGSLQGRALKPHQWLLDLVISTEIGTERHKLQKDIG